MKRTPDRFVFRKSAPRKLDCSNSTHVKSMSLISSPSKGPRMIIHSFHFSHPFVICRSLSIHEKFSYMSKWLKSMDMPSFIPFLISFLAFQGFDAIAVVILIKELHVQMCIRPYGVWHKNSFYPNDRSFALRSDGIETRTRSMSRS